MASLYRRHRPRTFADVVGQEHVVRTLRNAIEQDKVHHAYLFVGSRGTGKTSMAKILAASLNCDHGPTVTPDGTCESCRAIASATSLDVIEMDAASNNSVDDIRDLREKVAYAPVSGRYKVYILDEAHMLTAAAWNAFLKTLEEPPPHTIFVLATTEIQKVLPTVADRCHRFDFSRPTIAQIGAVLRRVADAEGIQAPDEALALVARSATGSFRDALGTLEQLVAYSGTSIALDDVLAVLGAADDELLFGTVDAIAAGSPRDALLHAARLAESGRDVARFFVDLETHLRGLMVVGTLEEVPAELAMTPEADARLLEQAQRVGPVQVTHALDLLADGLRAMKDGADARTQLELALLKAADPARDASQKALLARLERLERGGPAAPAASRAPGQAQTPAGQAAQRPAATPTPPGQTAQPPAATPGPPGQTATPPPGDAEPHAPVPAVGDGEPERAPGADAPVPAGRPDEGAPEPGEATGPAGQPYGEPPPQPVTATVQTGDGPAYVAAIDVPQEGVAVAVATDDLDLAGFRDLWPAVLEQLGATHLGAFLADAVPVALDAESVTIAFAESNDILHRQADRPANRDAIKEAVRTVTGRALALRLEKRADDELELDDQLAVLSEDELIDRVVQEFDATVLEEGESP